MAVTVAAGSPGGRLVLFHAHVVSSGYIFLQLGTQNEKLGFTAVEKTDTSEMLSNLLIYMLEGYHVKLRTVHRTSDNKKVDVSEPCSRRGRS